MKTCDRCLEFERCDISARFKPACGDYIRDPFKLAAREARWTFRKQKAQRENKHGQQKV